MIRDALSIAVLLVACEAACAQEFRETAVPDALIAAVVRDVAQWHDMQYPECPFKRATGSLVVSSSTGNSTEHWTIAACSDRTFTYKVTVFATRGGGVSNMVSNVDGSALATGEASPPPARSECEEMAREFDAILAGDSSGGDPSRVAVLAAGLASCEEVPAPPPFAGELSFAGTTYVHRWSGEHLHEFTPAGQEDLEAWRDMLTITHYPDVTDGEALAATANGVLGNYRDAGATILRTDSVPAASGRPAQHFIAAVFVRPTFTEAAFARFLIADGIGTAVIRGHRIHGVDTGARMDAWLSADGSPVEDALMALDRIPTRSDLDAPR